VLLGWLGLGWLLFAGLIALIRHRSGFLNAPLAPVFISILSLCIPIPLFMGQSFMALGDLTLASVLLALVTMLIPLGSMLTIRRTWLTRDKSSLERVHGMAAIFLLQWCVVLAVTSLLPLRLWS
jgi:hypothetical protein